MKIKTWKCLSLGVSRVGVLDRAEITACVVQEIIGTDRGLFILKESWKRSQFYLLTMAVRRMLSEI